jgi:hypothetical protein
MADLVVDLNLLESTDRALGTLAGEFKDASAIVNSYAGAIPPVLAQALDAFATDWNAHRQILLDSMQAVHEMASQGHQQFRGTDAKLARSLQAGQHSGG